MNSTASVARIDSLTGLRWWAAFFVFAFHMGVYAPLPFQDYLHIGHTGVSFFFILSGFVLTWSASPKVSSKEFWWRRFARIWPAHIVALFLALPVFYTLSDTPEHGWIKTFSIPILLLSVFLLQGFATDWSIMFSGNPAAWTLSSEGFFYALHPFIAPRREVSKGFILVLAVGAILTGFALHIFDAFTAVVPPPIARTWEFVLGIAAAYGVKHGLRIVIPSWVFIVALIVAAPSFFILSETMSKEQFFVIAMLADVKHVLLALLYTLIIVVAASRDLLGLPSTARHPVLVKLGEYSFAFYLVHATILYALRNYTGPVEWSIYALPFVWSGCLLAGLAVAALLHLCVEKPLERVLRRWGTQKFGSQKTA